MVARTESPLVPRIAVIGHVEHVTLGRVDGVVSPGDVVHLVDPRFVAAGGGGIAFAQLCRSDAEIHFFTAVGCDEGGRAVATRIAGPRERIFVHAAERRTEHPRVVVVVDREGRRTIVVTGAPLQPAADDPLPWSILADCDAVYFTGRDPQSLVLARAARRLVVTARRSEALRAAAVAPDVVVGSVADPRENHPFASYDPAPGALVLTDGPRPVRVVRGADVTLVDAPRTPERVVGDYGAGDSFAAALTFYLAHGLSVEHACLRAGPFGAAVLRGIDPLEQQEPLGAP
jgi:ribokinase